MTTKASRCQGHGINTFNSKPGKALQIQRISAGACYPLRQKVLRPNLPIEECHFECDSKPQTFHLGGYFQGELVGIATFFPEDCPQLAAALPFRLRGMAVDPLKQGLGIGKLILHQGELDLIEKKSDLIWFNARETAFRFYQSMNYQFASELFEIPGVGPHKVMLKKLTGQTTHNLTPD